MQPSHRKLTATASAFPSVIDAMAKGMYPLDQWVEIIPFDTLLNRGLERLRRQEGLKILVDVGSGADL